MGWDQVHYLGTAATSGLLYKPQMIDEDDCGAIGGMMIGRGNRSTRRNPIWPYPGSNAGRRGGKPATNRLSYGAAVADSNSSALCHVSRGIHWRYDDTATGSSAPVRVSPRSYKRGPAFKSQL
jgi:hypothetical protein